jgi:E3 ubiquitin-protein ligase RNF38/44
VITVFVVDLVCRCWYLQHRSFDGFVGAPGLASGALERTYYPAIGSSNSSVGAVPTAPSSGSATFANGGYAPRTVHGGAVHVYSHLAPATSSGPRAMPVETVIRSYPPAISAATSTSVRMQPLPARSAASSRHARHISVGHASNGRNRRARSSYYGFHPLMIEAEVDSLFFLVSMKLC